MGPAGTTASIGDISRSPMCALLFDVEIEFATQRDGVTGAGMSPNGLINVGCEPAGSPSWVIPFCWLGAATRLRSADISWGQTSIVPPAGLQAVAGGSTDLLSNLDTINWLDWAETMLVNALIVSLSWWLVLSLDLEASV